MRESALGVPTLGLLSLEPATQALRCASHLTLASLPVAQLVRQDPPGAAEARRRSRDKRRRRIRKQAMRSMWREI